MAFTEEWSEIVCHLTNLKPVKKLLLQVSHLGIPKHPNCSIWNISTEELHAYLHNFNNVSLELDHIEKLTFSQSIFTT